VIPLVGTDAHAGQPSFYMRLVDDVSDGGIDWIDGQCNSTNPDPDDCVETAAADLLPDTDADFLTYNYLIDDPAHPQTFVAAVADEGMGSYYLDPEFRLFVPAETYSGVYQSSLTITLIATAP
jgi:hypothetical protein